MNNIVWEAGKVDSFASFLNPVALALNLYRHRNLIRQLAWRDFVGRYKGSFLGVIWSVITPLMMLAAYAFVFSVVFQAKWDTQFAHSKINFALILFCGLTVFNIFGESINRAPGLILCYPNYVKKVVFPLEILPVAVLLSSLLNAFVSLAILLPANLILNGTISKTLIIFPLVMLPLSAMILGLSWFLSSLGVFVRDIGQAVGVFVTILLFMSGVFFPPSAVPRDFQFLMQINPLITVLEESRNTLIWGIYPDWKWLLFVCVVSFIIMMLGYAWFMRSKRAFSDVI